MAEQHTLLWEAGVSAASLPPLADYARVMQEEQPMVSLYRTYGPVFRLPQPGQAPRIVLAGPEINVFMARHEDEFFTTGAPFGLGDHTCLGAGIAEVQLMATMATLVANYTLQLDP